MKKMLMLALLLCTLAVAVPAFAGGPMPLCYPLACCGDSFTPLCMPPDCDPTGCSIRRISLTLDITAPVKTEVKAAAVALPMSEVDERINSLVSVDSKNIFNRKTGLYCYEIPAGTCGWCRTVDGWYYVCNPGLQPKRDKS